LKGGNLLFLLEKDRSSEGGSLLFLNEEVSEGDSKVLRKCARQEGGGRESTSSERGEIWGSYRHLGVSSFRGRKGKRKQSLIGGKNDVERSVFWESLGFPQRGIFLKGVSLGGAA